MPDIHASNNSKNILNEFYDANTFANMENYVSYSKSVMRHEAPKEYYRKQGNKERMWESMWIWAIKFSSVFNSVNLILLLWASHETALSQWIVRFWSKVKLFMQHLIAL